MRLACIRMLFALDMMEDLELSTPTFLLVLSICLMIAAITWVLFLVVLLRRNPDYGKVADFDRDDTTVDDYKPKSNIKTEGYTMNQKKSVLLLVSWILGALYLVYLVYYMVSAGGAAGSADAAEAIGTTIGLALIVPHLLFVGLALIFNILGWAMSKRGFALTGAILYAVSILMMPIYFMFVLVEMILSFVGFAKLKKPAA